MFALPRLPLCLALGAAAESEAVAGSVPDSGGVYFVPAFGGLLAPWWRDDARGAIVGLTQYSTKVRRGRSGCVEGLCMVGKSAPRCCPSSAKANSAERGSWRDMLPVSALAA